MLAEELKERIPEGELRFTASKSSGPGGQNVNKVNTKIELRFNVPGSAELTEEEKIIILNARGNKITTDGDILIISQSERSQLMNRRKAEEKLFKLLAKILTPVAERKPTTPTPSSRLKRIEKKKKRSALKISRKETGKDQERD